MFKKSIISILILPIPALCVILPKTLGNDDTLQASAITPTLSHAANSSSTYGNGSAGNMWSVQCSRIRYGRDLKPESCRKVFNYLGTDDTQVIFADRNSAQPRDVSLPVRTTSSKCPCTLSLLPVTFLKSGSEAILANC